MLNTFRFGALYFFAAVVAFSCVAYELLLASYATFLMGASVFQYSLVISIMMMSMGMGAFLTSRIKLRACDYFFVVELILSWIALVAIPVLYYCFSTHTAPSTVLLSFVCLLGMGIGMEIPLLTSIEPSEKRLTRILFFDYVGGFCGGMLFPLVLLPQLGFFRIGALLSVINTIVAGIFLLMFRERFHFHYLTLVTLALITLIVTIVGFQYSEALRVWMEGSLYGIRS